MKMHLVLAAAFVGLCSHAASARYDGGDTWSALEAKPYAPSIRSITVATTAPLYSLQRDYPNQYGTPADPDSVDRIVQLKSGSHWINVDYGERIKFVVRNQSGSERSFAWRFDVPNMSQFDLSRIAPADLPVEGVRVFVAPDPRYYGG